MCIIVNNPQGKELDKKLLSIAYDNNPHGVGVMWQEDNSVHTIKSLMKFEDLWTVTKHLAGLNYSLHFRWRTVGPIQEEQCHPHRILDKSKHGIDLFMMHNGTINGIKSKKNSDTQIFARKLRAFFENRLPTTDAIIGYVHGSLASMGHFNKFVFMDEYNVDIVNEEAGVWKDDVWYSNTYSFKMGYRTNNKKHYFLSTTKKDDKPIELYSNNPYNDGRVIRRQKTV